MCNFDGHIRNLGPVSVPLLEKLVQKILKVERFDPEFWKKHDDAKPNKFKTFEYTTQHVVFTFPISMQTHIGSNEFPIWSEWRQVIEPLIREGTKYYEYRNGRSTRIMLAKLLKGQTINKHVDATTSADVPHKIHIPLITNPQVEFWGANSVYYLEKGQAYEVNNKILHGGTNRSEQDRVHLIFDYWDAYGELLPKSRTTV